MLEEAEIEQRLPVWHAFSDLFLDVELQDHDYRAIADRLRHSGYSTAKLKAILEDEVAPAFATNLMSVAGDWTGWSEEEVREIMLRSLRSSRLSPARWLGKRFTRHDVREEWEKVAAFLRA